MKNILLVRYDIIVLLNLRNNFAHKISGFKTTEILNEWVFHPPLSTECVIALIYLLLAHLAWGHVSCCHHLASVVVVNSFSELFSSDIT